MPIEITMPRLSDTMESGTIIRWNVKVGDSVSAGDVIADIETDKATMEMQVFDDGVVAKLLVDEGESSDVGTLIAVLAEEDEDVDEAAQSAQRRNGEPKKKEKSAAASEVKDKERAEEGAEAEEADRTEQPSERPSPRRDAPQPAAAQKSKVDRDGRLRVSPVARRLAEEHGIELSQLQGSGPQGRIIKRDVLHAVEAGEETRAAVPPSAIERREPARVHPTPVTVSPPGLGMQEQIVPLSNMRQTIAKRLVESKTTIPHYQVTMTFNMDPLLELRESLNRQLDPQGIKLSVNDFLIRCCALAMYDNPEFNASFQGDSIHIHGEINIGMAIALPRERGGGLVVGVIRHADEKSLRTINAESRYLAEKARTKGLTLEEMSDSTFTLSNLGMYGVEHFTAIINPPNSAILAVGGAQEKPVVRNGGLAVGHEMQATLSSDHRVIDGAMSAEYLQTLKEYIEYPAGLLV